MRKLAPHHHDKQPTMNEMLTSAPKASATNLSSVSSSNAGLLLTPKLSNLSIRNAVHSVLDEVGSRTGHGHPQRNVAVLRRSAPDLLRREKSVPFGVSAESKRSGRNTDHLLNTLSRLDAYVLTAEVPLVEQSTHLRYDWAHLASGRWAPEYPQIFAQRMRA